MIAKTEKTAVTFRRAMVFTDGDVHINGCDRTRAELEADGWTLKFRKLARRPIVSTYDGRAFRSVFEATHPDVDHIETFVCNLGRSDVDQILAEFVQEGGAS